MTRLVPICCALLPLFAAGASAAPTFPAARSWDFEKDATGWTGPSGGAFEKDCGVASDPGAPANRVFRIVATKPHHTRIVLAGSAKTPDFLISLHYRLIEFTGEAPAVYVYGRFGADGFRAVSMRPTGGAVSCYRGATAPSTSIGQLPASAVSKSGWTHVSLACCGDYVLAKAWPEGSPEPPWQVEGVGKGQESGEVALGVWTSPRTPSTATVIFDDVRFAELAPETLKEWGIVVGPRSPLDLAALPKAPGVFESADRIGLVSPAAALAFDRASGDVANFVDLAARQEFIAQDVKSPLFRIELTKPYEGRSAQWSCRDFKKIEAMKTGDRSLELRFADLTAAPVTAVVTARLDADGSIRLGLKLQNSSDWSVASATFPRIAGAPALGSSSTGSGQAADDDWFLLPWHGGAILPAPGARSAQKDAQYPGYAFAQFYAYYDALAGMYCALNDPNGHSKQFQLTCQQGRSVAFDFIHQFPEVPSPDVALPYEVVLRTFRGDWRDAADIYKSWAVKTWGLKQLSERADIPEFLKDGSGLLIDSVGRGDQVAVKLGPNGEQAADLMDAYRQRTGLKRLIYVPYGWENRGTWAGINYLPANPSDDFWRRAIATLRARDHRAAFLTSGYWWVVKRQQTSNGPAFDDMADFERRRAMCVENADGSPWFVDNYNLAGQRMDWRGLSAGLCHGSADASAAMKGIFLDVARLGVPLISFDQEIGGGQKASCYSKSHSHPPGRGDWMWTGFRDLCAEILKDGKPIQPELGLFMENESELAIPYMATHWSRQFGQVDIGPADAQGIGLFSYLYHEYVTAIGAACVQGQGEAATNPDVLLRCRVLANNLTRGLIPGPFVNLVPLEGKSDFQKLSTQAFLSYCRPYSRFPEYLLLGKTRRPLEIECDGVETWFWRRNAAEGQPLKPGGPPLAKTSITLPAVTAGAFEAADGSMATFVVNATPDPRWAVLRLPAGKQATVYQADRTAAPEERVDRDAADARRMELSLEPFGVRVVVVK